MNSTFTTNCHCERPVGSVAVSWLSPGWEIAPVGETRTFIAMTNAGTKPRSLWGACDEESQMWWHSEPVGMEWALGFYIDRWPILYSFPTSRERDARFRLLVKAEFWTCRAKFISLYLIPSLCGGDHSLSDLWLGTSKRRGHVTGFHFLHGQKTNT